MTSANVSNIAAQGMMANPTAQKTLSTDAKFVSVMSQTANDVNGIVTKDVKTSDMANGSKDLKADPKSSYEAAKSDTKASEIKVTSDDSKEISSDKIDEIKDAFEEFSNEVKAVLQEDLSVSEQDIENAMEVLNLTMIDMLNPADVSKLVGEITNATDSISLLLDENASDAIGRISSAANFMLEEVNVEPADFTQVLKQSEVTADNMTIVLNPEDVNDEVVKNLDIQSVQVDVKATESTQTKSDFNPTAGVINTEDQNSSEPVIAAKAEEVKTAEVDVKDIKVEDNTSKEVKNNQVEVIVTKATDLEEESTSQNQSGFEENFGFNKKSENSVLNHTIHSDVNHASFNDNLNEVAFEKAAEPTPVHVDTRDIINQISEQAKVSIAKHETSMEMILNPEHLGRVYLQVTEKEGSIRAQLQIQNQEVKEAMVNQMAILRENLEKSGVKVDAIEVSVGTHEFEKNLEEDMHRRENEAAQYEDNADSNRNRSRNINMNELDELQGLMTDEEMLIAQMMADEGNTLNYLA